ncbi:MAG: DUF3857 domain-containing protein [Pedobacter sp.]|nr:MAG: DUF3857 domain-containing protein [Pedobacter sp.]
MKKIVLMNLLLAAPILALCQGVYDVAKIAPAMLNNASVVIRNEEQLYDIKNPGNAHYEYKAAITILNKNGESASNMHEFYDKFSTVYNMKATLYDAKGEKVREFKNTDFKDRSFISNGSIYEDNRMKFLNIMHTSFPYTIEYSYSMDYTGIRFYPSWHPVPSWGYAVEKSAFTFKIPDGMTFKYLKSKGIKTDSVKAKEKTQYKWSAENIEALEYEPMSIGFSNVTPWVNIAPNQLEYDNSKANIENWTSLGTWLYGLSSGLQVLPQSAKAKVQDLIKDAKTSKEKISVLYNYLQANTRYVGVQLGIGGYKPIAAEKVSAVNYSDCKGLSNYMKAMLEEAGIKSNLVVIGNDLPSLNPTYASLTQANHMILCVPLEKDTTWLECTSQYVPAGFIGNGNSDKTILLITEKGGKLAQTPTYTPALNYQKRSTKVTLDELGSADINILTKYGNAQYEDNLGMMLMEPTDQRKRLMNNLSIPNVQIVNLNYKQPNKNEAVMVETIDLKSSQLLTKGGDKLFLTLNLLNRQDGTAVAVENRKTYFAVNYSYSDEDEIVYNIPKGYKVEFLPKDILIESEFGKYTSKVVEKDNQLVYTRTKMMTNKKYPPEKYSEYVAFSKKIFQADKQKGILAKID